MIANVHGGLRCGSQCNAAKLHFLLQSLPCYSPSLVSQGRSVRGRNLTGPCVADSWVHAGRPRRSLEEAAEGHDGFF